MLSYLENLDKRVMTIAGIVVAVIFLFFVNIVSTAEIRSVRLDLTQDKLFTLSKGTTEVLKSIDEPITFRYYYSRKLGEISPAIGNYENRVRELLQHYASISGGKIILSVINPEPFSVEEDEAVKQGVQGIPLDQTGEPGYFGLAATNSTDDRELIPFFDQSREQFLEFDLTRILFDLAEPEKKKVGLLTSLLIEADPMRQYQPWPILQQIQQFFDFKSLDSDVEVIPEDIDVLLIAHPKISNERTLYAVDQFIMRGGRVVALIDPHNESARMSPRLPPGAGASELKKLFDTYGIVFDDSKFVGDRGHAIRVSANVNNRDVIADYVSWVNYDKRNLNPKDVVTADLSSLTLASVGAISAKEGAVLDFTPLVQTSTFAQRISTKKIQDQPNPAELLREFKSENKAFTVAARISGKMKTAFPDGQPPKKEKKGDAAAKKEDEKPPVKIEHLAESRGNVQMIVIADTDLISAQFWLQEREFFGQRMRVPIANNADLVVNSLENMAGSEGLIGLRSRGLSQRPFHKILNLQNQAEDRYSSTEQKLSKQLADIQEKLKDVKVDTKDGKAGDVILSTAQREQFNNFRQEMLRVRRELRDVQHALRSDIESLDSTLKLVNIWAVPLLVAVVAIILALVRRRRYRQPAVQG